MLGKNHLSAQTITVFIIPPPAKKPLIPSQKIHRFFNNWSDWEVLPGICDEDN